jgi:hypothetical protein
MAEVLVAFPEVVRSKDGSAYRARACGAEDDLGHWQGWIEFVPLDGGQPIRSPRETTQPNRRDAEYWATGLTPVYLDGALARALGPPHVVFSSKPEAPAFDGPAPAIDIAAGPEVRPVMDPFAVYQNGERLLRRQLGALSVDHLVNIVLAYGLSPLDSASLHRMSAAGLVQLIVSATGDRVKAAR